MKRTLEKITDKILFRISGCMNYPWWFNKIHIRILYSLFGFENFNKWWVIKKTMGSVAFLPTEPIEGSSRWKPFWNATKISLNDIHSVFDLGGSWGSTAELFFKNGYKGKYIIRDLPIVEKLQDYYLSLHGIKISHSDIENVDLFYAGFSLSEMPLNTRRRYESKIENAKYVLVYYQSGYHGIDNIKYFEELSQKMNKHWIIALNGAKTNYIIGMPK